MNYVDTSVRAMIIHQLIHSIHITDPVLLTSTIHYSHSMEKAPRFFLTTTGASRLVGGPPGPSCPTMLIFHGYVGAQTAHNLNANLRGIYPKIDMLQIISVVDLHSVPRFMRPAVTLTLSAAYRHSAASVPTELDPREYVLIAPDWEGTVTRAFAMTERVHDIGLVLITAPWLVCDRYIGNDPQSAAVSMLAACHHFGSGALAASPAE
jgi:hypothetical protein